MFGVSIKRVNNQTCSLVVRDGLEDYHIIVFESEVDEYRSRKIFAVFGYRNSYVIQAKDVDDDVDGYGYDFKLRNGGEVHLYVTDEYIEVSVK